MLECAEKNCFLGLQTCHALNLYQNFDVLFIYQYRVSRPKLEPWSKPRKLYIIHYYYYYYYYYNCIS